MDDDTNGYERTRRFRRPLFIEPSEESEDNFSRKFPSKVVGGEMGPTEMSVDDFARKMKQVLANPRRITLSPIQKVVSD